MLAWMQKIVEKSSERGIWPAWSLAGKNRAAVHVEYFARDEAGVLGA